MLYKLFFIKRRNIAFYWVYLILSSRTVLFTVIKSYIYKLPVSGLVTQLRSISVSVTLITHKHVHYRHHIHLLAGPFFYFNAHYSSLSVIVQILYFTESLVYFLEVLVVQCPESNSLSTAAAAPPRGSSSPAEIPVALRQSAALILARISDVTHHPMNSLWLFVCCHIVQVTSHLRRNLQSPPIYNDTKPIFATIVLKVHEIQRNVISNTIYYGVPHNYDIIIAFNSHLSENISTGV